MTTHCVTLNALEAPSVYSGELRRWERPEGAELLDDRILASCKVFTSDRLLPFEQCAFSSCHALWLSLMFSYSYALFVYAREIVTSVFIEPSRTLGTKQSGWGEGRLAPSGIGFSRFVFPGDGKAISGNREGDPSSS